MNVGSSPMLAPSTASDSTLEFAKKWIEDCQTSHPRCPLSMGFKPPTRLVDISSDNIRLCTTRERGIHPPYATLSHCWGTVSFFTLTQSNHTSLLQGIPFQNLTKTFQDAIAVSRRLGFFFIWIDSLCIIQDDEDDWRRESALMSQVYGNAVVNIAASKAENGSFGLFTERDPRKVDRQFIRSSTSDVYEVLDNESYNRCVVKAPLSVRGWAFQERFLSARTLHFTGEQIFCECRSGIINELLPNGIPRAQISRFKFPHDRENMKSWFQAVVLYSRTSLTFSTDKLVALSGIARHFQDIYKYEYVGGLWRKDIERQLCWAVINHRINTRARTYQAPTFSWASLNQAISWDWGSFDDITTDLMNGNVLISVMGSTVVPVGTDPLGQLKDATLQIQTGPMIHGDMFFHEHSIDVEPHSWKFGTGKKETQVKVLVSISWDIEEDQIRTKDNISFLPILERWGRGYPDTQSAIDEINGTAFFVIRGLIVATGRGPGSRYTASSKSHGHFSRLGVSEIRWNAKSYNDMIRLLQKDPKTLMHTSLYQKDLHQHQDEIRQYVITLV